MKTIIFALLMICLLLAPAYAQPPYFVGDHVDDFTLLDSDGNPVSLSDFPNRIIMMAFWETG